MSRSRRSRTGTQTPSSVYLPLRMSSNIPAFASMAVQGSKTSLDEHEMISTDLSRRDRSPQRRPGSPFPGSEAYRSLGGVPSHNPAVGTLRDCHGCIPPQRYMTGDFVTVPFCGNVQSAPSWNVPIASTLQEFHTIPGARKNSTKQKAPSYHSGQLRPVSRRKPLTSAHCDSNNEKVGVNEYLQTPVTYLQAQPIYPRPPAADRIHLSTELEPPLVSTKVNFNTSPCYNYIDGSGFRAIPAVNDIPRENVDFRRIPSTANADRSNILTSGNSPARNDCLANLHSTAGNFVKLSRENSPVRSDRLASLSDTGNNFVTSPHGRSPGRNDYPAGLLHASGNFSGNAPSRNEHSPALSGTTNSVITVPPDTGDNFLTPLYGRSPGRNNYPAGLSNTSGNFVTLSSGNVPSRNEYSPALSATANSVVTAPPGNIPNRNERSFGLPGTADNFVTSPCGCTPSRNRRPPGLPCSEGSLVTLPAGYTPSRNERSSGLSGTADHYITQPGRYTPVRHERSNNLPGTADSFITPSCTNTGNLDSINSNFRYTSTPYDNNRRRRSDFQNIQQTSDFSTNNDKYFTLPRDYVERGTNMDLNFDSNPTPQRNNVCRITKEIGTGGDSNSPTCSDRVDRGVSAMAISQQTPIRYPRRSRRYQLHSELPVVPEEINHSTQCPKMAYMTPLSKCCRRDEKVLGPRHSPILDKNLNMQETQVPSVMQLPDQSFRKNNDVFVDLERSYGRQSIPAEITRLSGGNMYSHLEMEPPLSEIERNYITRRPSPSALNKSYSIAAGRRPSPLATSALTMNRTMSTPHAINRTHITLPPPRRSRSPGGEDRKCEDILHSKKTGCDECSCPSVALRRASTLDIPACLPGDESTEVPLYKSYSDSSIDMTDDSSHLPLPPKKTPCSNLRRFRPLPKLYEEATVDTEFGPMKESEYFEESKILGNRTPNSNLRKVIPMILEDMSIASRAIPAMGGVPITTPRRSPPPLRSTNTWEKLHRQAASIPGFITPNLKSNPVQKWGKDIYPDKKDEENEHGKDVMSVFTAEGDLQNASSTKTFDSKHCSDSTFDTGSQIGRKTKTKGVQVRGSKMKNLGPTLPRIKKKKAMEDMYQSINKDILF